MEDNTQGTSSTLIADLKAQRVELVKKLEELKAKKLSMKNDKSAKYRKFGDELVNTDTAAAGKFYSMADSADQKDKALAQSAEAKDKASAMAETKQLAIMYRNARTARLSDKYTEMGVDAQDAIESEMSGIRTTLSKDAFGRKLMGMVDADENIDNTTPDSTTTVEPPKPTADYKAINTAIKEGAVDKNKDGYLDTDKATLNLMLDDFVKENKLDSRDVTIKNLKAYISSKANSVKDKYDTRHSESEVKRKESKADHDSLKKRAFTQKPIYSALSEMRASPDNVSTRANALNLVLRKESGAAIGSNEYAAKLQTWLSAEDYDAYISELGGIKGYLAIKAGAGDLNAINALAKYLKKVNISKIDTSLRSYMEDDVIEYYDNKANVNAKDGGNGGKGAKPARADYKSLMEWKNAVTQWEGK